MSNNRDTYFTTITIENWVSVFQEFPSSNFIIISAFEHFSSKTDIEIYGFVIMRDHLHLLWSTSRKNVIKDTITAFKKFTGRKITDYLKLCNSEYLQNFQSERRDRNYKIWKVRSGNLKIVHPEIFYQKLNYIHQNPTKGEYKTCEVAEDYLFSSARAYSTKERNFTFLKMIDPKTIIH